jgi:hypothetical protein
MTKDPGETKEQAARMRKAHKKKLMSAKWKK